MGFTVALDTTPLIGHRTGIGEFTARLLESLPLVDDPPDIVPFVLSRRAGSLPPGTRRLVMPARLGLRVWARVSWPRERRAFEAVDVVHGTNYIAPPTGRPTILTVHDTSPITNPERCEPGVRSFVPVLRRLVESGAWVHTPSEHVARQVRELLGTDRVHAVHSGAPELITRGGDPHVPERPFVLAVATAEPRKNLPRLVAAYGQAQRRLPELALVIAGADGSDGPAIEAAIAVLDKSALVVRTGRIDDARRSGLLLAARALAYPSYDEGFGFPLLEAMAAGLPVVASAAGAIPEIAGNAALLVAAVDTDALADALVRVVDDTALRTELINRGRARLEIFSWRATAEGLNDLYRRAVAEA
ncbi:MAG: glycosyltransferase family 1 protein [Acidimicrobiales bacterium]